MPTESTLLSGTAMAGSPGWSDARNSGTVDAGLEVARW